MVKKVGTGLNNSFRTVLMRDSLAGSVLAILLLSLVRANRCHGSWLEIGFLPLPLPSSLKSEAVLVSLIILGLAGMAEWQGRIAGQ